MTVENIDLLFHIFLRPFRWYNDLMFSYRKYDLSFLFPLSSCSLVTCCNRNFRLKSMLYAASSSISEMEFVEKKVDNLRKLLFRVIDIIALRNLHNLSMQNPKLTISSYKIHGLIENRWCYAESCLKTSQILL